MNKHLRRLAPALAALVVGCNINESSSTEVASTSTGTLSPRLTMVNGSTIPEVDSLLVLLTVEGSSYSQDLKVGWNDAALQLKQIPLNKKWTLKIAGFMHADTVLANRDTAWYGEQTGTLTDSTPQTKNATALAIGLKSAATTPAVAIGANAPGTTQKVGDTFTFAGGDATQVVWTLDGSQPVCPDSPGTTQPLVLGTNLASKTVTLKARACTAGELPGRVAHYSFNVVAKDVVIPPTISIPVGFDSTGTTKAPYDSSLTLSLPTGTTLTWNLALVNGTAAPSAADWKVIATPTPSAFTGNTAAIKVPAAWLATMAPTATEAQVLVKAVLWQGTTAIDTATLHWTLTVPVTASPKLDAKPYTDSVRIFWTAGQVDSLWARRAEETSRTKVTLDSKDTAFVHALKPGQADTFWAIRKDPTTGRFSDTTRLTSAALLPPVKPKFTAANSDPVNGTITIQLDAETLREQSTTWSIGLTQDTTLKSFENGTPDKSGTWSANHNTGRYLIGVRAMRDGIERDSAIRVNVQRTAGLAPHSAVGLTLTRRDSNALVWKWNAVHGRSYAVHVQNDQAFASVSNLGSSTLLKTGEVDSIALEGLAAGAKRAIAVVALRGTTDSTIADAEPTYSSLDSTRTPPSQPEFSATNTDTATGTLSISIKNFEAQFTSWEAGYGTNKDSLTWARISIPTFSFPGLVGNYFTAVRATRDSLTKTATRSQTLIKFTNNIKATAPSNISLTALDETSLSASWSGTTGASYQIAAWEASICKEENIPNSAIMIIVSKTETTTRKIEGYSAGTTVCFGVRTNTTPDATGGPSAWVLASGTTKAASAPVLNLAYSIEAETVTFTWTNPSSASSLSYTTASGTTTPTTLVTSAKAFYGKSDTAVDFSITATNNQGVISKAAVAHVHIPTLRGATNLANWDIHLAGSQLVITSAPDSHKPDSIITSVTNLGRELYRWEIAGNETLAKRIPISVEDGAFEVSTKMRWLNGDSTSNDIRTFSAKQFAPGSATTEIYNGRDSVTFSLTGSTTGWNGYYTAILHDHTTETITIKNGKGSTSLGIDSLRFFFVNGKDTSISQTIAISRHTDWKDQRNGIVYNTVRVNGKRWMTDPLRYIPSGMTTKCSEDITDNCEANGVLYRWLDVSGLQAYPISGGINTSQLDANPLSSSICSMNSADGWRMPTIEESYEFLANIAPGWSYSTRMSTDVGTPFNIIKFHISGKIDQGGSWQNYPAFWSGTSSDLTSIGYGSDSPAFLYMTSTSAISAMNATGQSVSNNAYYLPVHCIHD